MTPTLKAMCDRRSLFLALLVAAAVLAMPAEAAIQYAGGTNVNTTFVTTAGTRAEVVAGLEAALTTAGWTTISGGGTGDVLMQSAATPQSLQCRLRLFDPGSGASAAFYMRNVSGSVIQTTPLWFRATALETVRVIANKYQFIMKTEGTVQQNKWVAGGVPWKPTFIPATEIIWGQGNGDSAAASGAGNSCTFNGRLSANSGMCHQFNDYGGAVWERVANTGVQVGLQQFLTVHGAETSNTTGSAASGTQWKDNSFFISDSIICWGDASETDAAKCVGQLWDTAILSSEFAADTTITFDSKTWRAITSSNAGSAGNYTKGTLFHVVP